MLNYFFDSLLVFESFVTHGNWVEKINTEGVECCMQQICVDMYFFFFFFEEALRPCCVTEFPVAPVRGLVSATGRPS